MSISQTLSYLTVSPGSVAETPKAKYLPSAIDRMFRELNPTMPYHLMEIRFERGPEKVDAIHVHLTPVQSMANASAQKLEKMKAQGKDPVLAYDDHSVTLGILLEEKAFMRHKYAPFLEDLQRMITYDYGLR